MRILLRGFTVCNMALASLGHKKFINEAGPLWQMHYQITYCESLSHGRNGSNFTSVISKHMLRSKFMSISCEIALRWSPQNTFDDMSTLAQVMAWCRQAPSHYLSQCWPRPTSLDEVLLDATWRQQAITWANVNPVLCHHMASLGHKESMKNRQTKFDWS